MQVILKKSLEINKIKLNKGDKGFLRACQMDSQEGDTYWCDFGENSFLPIPKEHIEFPKAVV